MKFKKPFQLSYSLCVEVSNAQLWICVDLQTFLILLGLPAFQFLPNNIKPYIY